MIKFIKKLFCKHEIYKTIVFSDYGEDYFYNQCIKCGKKFKEDYNVNN